MNMKWNFGKSFRCILSNLRCVLIETSDNTSLLKVLQIIDVDRVIKITLRCPAVDKSCLITGKWKI